MRITKELVNKIARELCQPKSDAIVIKKQEFSQEVYLYALGRVPKELRDLDEYKTIKPYIKTATNVYLVDFDKHGLRKMNHANFVDELPIKESCFGNYSLSFDELDVSYFVEKARQIESLIKEKNDLLAEIEVVLASLKTYKQIADKFPEAAPYLPQPDSTSLALSIPIDSVRNKLNNK